MNKNGIQINYIKNILDNNFPLLKVMDILDDIQSCKIYDYEYFAIKDQVIIDWLYHNDLINADIHNLYEPTEKFDEIYEIIKKQLEEYDECVA